jgi:hypothetical protein
MSTNRSGGTRRRRSSPSLGPALGHVRGSAAVIYLVILASASAGLLARARLMGTRFDDHGIRVRKYFSTRRFGWPEVSHFADGGWINDGDDQRWVLDIVLRDGRTVTTGATSSGKTAPSSWRRSGRPPRDTTSRAS